MYPLYAQTVADGVVFNAWTVGISLFVVLAGVVGIAWFWWEYGRDRLFAGALGDVAAPLFGHEPVTVEFEPPQNLRPAQLGLLLHEIADTTDITATIVDLAGRGVVSITPVPGQHDWLIAWTPNQATDILPFEKTLLDALFVFGRREVHISELRGNFRPALQLVQSQMYRDAMARHFFRMRPDYLRYGRIFGGILIAFLGVWIAGDLAQVGGSLVGLAVSLVGVLVALTYKFMSVRTAVGRELLQRTVGFRLYINTAEKYRQQFAEKTDQFTRLLPYAIVFGATTGWARAFEGIDMAPSQETRSIGVNQQVQAAVVSALLQAMDGSIVSALASKQAVSLSR